MIDITILTPSYNRKDTLKRLYESLLKQTDMSFTWTIVDDGSQDETKETVEIFQKEMKIPINYYVKTNGGKHAALNFGVNFIDTKLTFIVDSDDYLKSSAIEVIKKTWKNHQSNKKIGGIWFLNETSQGNILGDSFHENEFVGNYVKEIVNKKVKGDKATVYLTEALKNSPSPVFLNEKRVATGYIHKKISEKYDVIFSNTIIYICDYQEDGLTSAGINWRIKNPLGGIVNSNVFMTNDIRYDIRIKKNILYLAYNFLANNKVNQIISKSNSPFMTILMLPFGYLVYLTWRKK